ncbi:MAG TPA: DUF11 domain-containing protein [Anaerolineae bacterium]|jgi:uncharacterized repeat protein (TIGR01451 family)
MGKFKLKTVVGIVVIILTLSALIIVIGVDPYLLTSSAQGPPDAETNGLPLSKESLAAFGLSPDSIQAADLSYDVQVVKTANVSTVDSGDMITFSIAIKNNGPDTAQLVFFYDDYPTQMHDVTYVFSTAVISDGLAKPKFAISDIPNSGTVNVTITGKLSSAPNVTVKNTAIITPFVTSQQDSKGNNSSAFNVNINGSNPGASDGRIFLPIMFKSPPPPPIVLAYSENFNSGDPWVEFGDDNDGCQAENRSSQYWVWLRDRGETCLPPADANDHKPETPFRTYGEFEVDAYQSEGPNRDTAFGLFINGAGGDNYYYFRIWPNDSCGQGGDWQLVRRRGGNEQTLLQGACNPAIKRGTGSGSTNKLKIHHDASFMLSVYVNDVQLGSTFDTQGLHLTGIATGVYAYTNDGDIDQNNAALIKFDNFTVYKFQ